MSTARPLYLHIGLQKTGTSYLQSIFWQSQGELARQGVDMVPGSKRDTFHLMLRVRDRYQPDFDPPEVAHALEALPKALKQAHGRLALISEESLAASTAPQIRALLAACADREVHLILTLRDLGRQIPSAWQQVLQSGGTQSFERYLNRLAKQRSRRNAKLWVNKDMVAVLARWGEFVPPERVHLVVVPPPGSAPTALLERFCSIIGVDAARLGTDVARLNESLGRAQAEVLAMVNARLSKTDRRRDVYGDVGKRYLAVKMLVPQRGRRITIPDHHQGWVTEHSRHFITQLTQGRYNIVGALDELLPTAASFSPHEDEPTEAEVAEAAVAALAGVVGDRAEALRKRRKRRPIAGVGSVGRFLKRHLSG